MKKVETSSICSICSMLFKESDNFVLEKSAAANVFLAVIYKICCLFCFWGVRFGFVWFRLVVVREVRKEEKKRKKKKKKKKEKEKEKERKKEKEKENILMKHEESQKHSYFFLL